MAYPCRLDLGSLWLGLRPGSVGSWSLWVLRSRLLLGIIRVLLWTRLLLLIFVVGVGVKVSQWLRPASAEKIRVKVRVVPESPRALPSVWVRGRRRPRELSLAVLPLPPGRWRPPLLLLIVIWELARLSLSPDLLRIPTEAKLSDVGKADLVEEAEILLRKTVVHGLFWIILITMRWPRSLTLWSHSLRLSRLKIMRT